MLKLLKGFTLMELMVTLVIVGIVMGIAVPSYQQYLQKVRTQEAKSLLITSTKHMQQYYQQHHSFEKATISNTGIPPYSTHHHFSPNLASTTQHSYDIEALPLQAREPCQALHINQLGILEKRSC